MSKERYTPEEVVAAIEYEGFNYAFSGYLSCDRLPPEIASITDQYLAMENRLKDAVRKMADENGLEYYE